MGDTEGAMKMQLDLATLRNQTNQANLAEGTLAANIANADLQNEALLAGIGLTEQQIEEAKTLLPHKRTEYILDAVAKRSANRVSVATEDDQISKSKSDAISAKASADVDQLIAENFEESNYLRKKSEKTGFLAAIKENEARELDAKVALSESNQKLAVNDMMANFSKLAKAGEFADDKAAQDWMVDKMFDINPTLALEMRDKYNSHELAVITHSSTMFKTKAMEAYQQGGVEGLSKAIDQLNGVDDTEIEYNDKNDDVTIWAVDPKTKKRLRKIVTGTPGGTFDMNLQQMLDPAASMEISKAYHDDLKAQADILYVEAETEYKKSLGLKADAEAKAVGKTKEFKKDDFFIRMLMEDPENELAWQGLVGMDLTAEEIQDKLRQEKMRQGEKPKDDTGTRTDDTKDGVVYKSSEDKTSTEKTSGTDTSKSYANTLKQAQANVGAFKQGTPQRKEAEARLAELTTVEGLTALIERLNSEIDESLNKPKATSLQNTKLRNQKTKFRDELIAELEKLSKGLGG